MSYFCINFLLIVNLLKYVPSRVFFLEMTDDIAIERITFRGVDPVTGEW